MKGKFLSRSKFSWRGQELETFGKMAHLLLHDYKHSKEQDIIGSWESCLQPQSMAEWFRLAQKSVEGSGWLHSNLWYAFLMPALDTILGFRQSFSRVTKGDPDLHPCHIV